MTMSGCAIALPLYAFGDLSVDTRAGPGTALPHRRGGNSSWDDLQRCPVGATEISVGTDSAGAGGSSKRRRDVREK